MPAVANGHGDPVGLGTLVVAPVGSLEETGNAFLPYELLDAERVPIAPVSAYLAELAGRRAIAANLGILTFSQATSRTSR